MPSSSAPARNPGTLALGTGTGPPARTRGAAVVPTGVFQVVVTRSQQLGLHPEASLPSLITPKAASRLARQVPGLFGNHLQLIAPLSDQVGQ
jgi:hypothetical protein